jgi:threonine aldolase
VSVAAKASIATRERTVRAMIPTRDIDYRSRSMKPIDMRSDTVTQPTRGMRAAMADAEVGDDVYGEDPTVNRLEADTAALLGKEAALFVPSGTMANQIALQCLTRPGDEVIVGEEAHLEADESGAGAAWAGVQFRVAGKGGLFTAADLERAHRAPDYHAPRSALVAIENTHNRAGGRVFPEADVKAIVARARALGLALHLDGARLWNAAIASKRTEAELAAPFDTVSVCFSKGLGAPIGSAIAGDKAAMEAARRFRKMFGGGMRQAGVLAAAALYALEHHRARLADDHARALELGAALGDVSPRARVVAVETNQVAVDTAHAPAERLVEAAAKRGVLVGAMGPHRTRAVVHLDVSDAQLAEAKRALVEAVAEVAGP